MQALRPGTVGLERELPEAPHAAHANELKVQMVELGPGINSRSFSLHLLKMCCPEHFQTFSADG